MIGFLKKYKGYIFHGLAVAVVVVSPGVQAILAAHPASMVVGGLVWGWVLHWATGK